MRIRRSRTSDSTFDLNLAPFLDIIVSIIPLLLLSVAFVQIKMIETSIPQVVAAKIAEQHKNKKIPVSLNLKASKKSGFVLTVNNRGRVQRTKLALNKEGKLDYDGLNAAAAVVKQKHTDVFRIDFEPRSDVSYDEIVQTMDSLRRLPAGQKVAFKDTKSGEKVETDLMFPDVTFANILGN